MKLTDVSYGPDWIVWVVFFILTIMSITLLLGHGSWLIAELFEKVLPSNFTVVMIIIIIIDVTAIEIASNTICKR